MAKKSTSQIWINSVYIFQFCIDRMAAYKCISCKCSIPMDSGWCPYGNMEFNAKYAKIQFALTSLKPEAIQTSYVVESSDVITYCALILINQQLEPKLSFFFGLSLWQNQCLFSEDSDLAGSSKKQMYTATEKVVSHQKLYYCFCHIRHTMNSLKQLACSLSARPIQK